MRCSKTSSGTEGRVGQKTWCGFELLFKPVANLVMNTSKPGIGNLDSSLRQMHRAAAS